MRLAVPNRPLPGTRVAYIKEIVGRTEQYWCPIKHARRVRQTHPYYGQFVDYGNAEAFRLELQDLRDKLARLNP